MLHCWLFETSLETKLEFFPQFYKKLYSSSHPTQEDIGGFGDCLNILPLLDEHRGSLDSPISDTEVEQEAISGLRNNKAPRLHVFTAEFYKKFKGISVPKLCKLFNGGLVSK